MLLQLARLRELALNALHTLSIHYTHLGKPYYEIAIGYARQLLRLAPFQEEAHRHLMMLLALNGQRSEALAQFKTCSQVLEEELNVEPSVDTQKLYEQIRDDAVEPITPPPPFLVTDQENLEPALFVGRQAEFETLGVALDAACSGDGQVFFIIGGPGCGKTVRRVTH